MLDTSASPCDQRKGLKKLIHQPIRATLRLILVRVNTAGRLWERSTKYIVNPDKYIVNPEMTRSS